MHVILFYKRQYIFIILMEIRWVTFTNSLNYELKYNLFTRYFFQNSFDHNQQISHNIVPLQLVKVSNSR